MNIFVINSGSSSIKYQLIQMPEKVVVCIGTIDRIGLPTSTIIHKTYVNRKEQVITQNIEIADHTAGLQRVVELLTDGAIGVINDPSAIAVVGHRVVHGGESFADTMVISAEVKKAIKKLCSLAPLHNPSNFLGIEVAEKFFPIAKQVAVFDTAFHQTIPPKAFRFAIPDKFYHAHAIRAYGFHGTSHKYVSQKAIDYLKKSASKIITIHLGNGCSMSAIENGKCVDTSMGLGPMNGLIMGTRCGDIDPSVIFHLVNQLGYDLNEVNTILNKNSGMLGLTGYSDMREISAAIKKGDAAAQLAYDIYTYRIRKYIGAYAAVLNGLDAIVFTGGVGENDALTREMSLSNLHYLGIVLDSAKNDLPRTLLHEIHAANSKVKILVIATNEEQEIASQCYDLLVG